MKKVFDISIFATFSIILGYFINTIFLVFLDKLPTQYTSSKNDTNFFNISLSKLFFHTQNNTISKINQPIENIQNFTLKAIYGAGKNGFIIIEDKNKKSTFINYSDTYQGYKLIKININSAVFEKNNKKYILSFKHKMFTNISEPMHKITKKTVQKYANNLDYIWSNIHIDKVSNGYLITNVKPLSIFDKLGLKKGDILIEVNGRKLSSDLDALYLYKNLNNYHNFTVEIIRNHQRKVLHYEID